MATWLMAVAVINKEMAGFIMAWGDEWDMVKVTTSNREPLSPWDLQKFIRGPQHLGTPGTVRFRGHH